MSVRVGRDSRTGPFRAASESESSLPPCPGAPGGALRKAARRAGPAESPPLVLADLAREQLHAAPPPPRLDSHPPPGSDPRRTGPRRSGPASRDSSGPTSRAAPGHCTAGCRASVPHPPCPTAGGRHGCHSGRGKCDTEETRPRRLAYPTHAPSTFCHQCDQQGGGEQARDRARERASE
jgi:hypothetical protein